MKRFTKHTLVRYIIGGGSSAVVNLSTLYVFNTILGIYYLTASIFSFTIAFFVSLFFHKYWTFREHSRTNLGAQGALYLLTSLCGLGVNTLILYIAVSLVHLPVLAGQIIAGCSVACGTFFVSKHFVFRAKPIESQLPTNRL